MFPLHLSCVTNTSIHRSNNFSSLFTVTCNRWLDVNCVHIIMFKISFRDIKSSELHRKTECYLEQIARGREKYYFFHYLKFSLGEMKYSNISI